MRGLVLDLRGNGGGLVSAATRVAGEFLPRGAVVYTSSGRRAELTDTARVGRSFWQSERRYPIVVLVDEGTASASELVAGALQDHDRAWIVGRPTFGKALLMQGFPLTEGSMIVLVIGTVHTPCGRSVQREYRGITTRQYYRAAAAAREREGRAPCTTASGRTVYGGGGIFPDAVLSAPPAPALWLQRALEAELPLNWVAGYVEAHGAAWSDLTVISRDDVALDAVASFRTFAEQQGFEMPASADADLALRRVLLPRIAAAKWGTAAHYRVLADMDPDIDLAAAELPRAAELLRPR